MMVTVLSMPGMSGGRSADENLTISISFDSIILSAVIGIVMVCDIGPLGTNTKLPNCLSKSSPSARNIRSTQNIYYYIIN